MDDTFVYFLNRFIFLSTWQLSLMALTHNHLNDVVPFVLDCVLYTGTICKYRSRWYTCTLHLYFFFFFFKQALIELKAEHKRISSPWKGSPKWARVWSGGRRKRGRRSTPSGQRPPWIPAEGQSSPHGPVVWRHLLQIHSPWLFVYVQCKDGNQILYRVYQAADFNVLMLCRFKFRLASKHK